VEEREKIHEPTADPPPLNDSSNKEAPEYTEALALLQSGLVNSWVLYRHFQRIHLLEYTEALAEAVLTSDFE